MNNKKCTFCTKSLKNIEYIMWLIYNPVRSYGGMSMNETIVRVQRIELENFKNIKNGHIDLSIYKQKRYFEDKADVLGIYGQNGSGKTAIIEAFNLFKTIVSGEKLQEDVNNYIYVLEDKSTLKFVFYVKRRELEFLVHYEFTIRKNEGQVQLSNEKLSYARVDEDNKKRKTSIIEYDIKLEDTIILPKSRQEELIKIDKENELNLKMCKRISVRDKVSFIFNEELIKIFKNEYVNVEHNFIIEAISHFAKSNLFVITNEHSAPISLNFIIPISFRMDDGDTITSGDIPINLLGPSFVSEQDYGIVMQIIKQLNIVLETIIPNTQLEIINLGNELSEKAEKITKIELLVVKKNIKIPLKYESEGIKKIISILSTLISMFNNPAICLLVDELDAGIFEYLLGELLNIIEQQGRGQFIFTSHNLRALEKLKKDSLIFSTTNPDNRFITIIRRGNSNLRDTYLRGVDLGGFNEPIYEETNSFEIAYAFREAGDIFGQ
jgi:AAA15 family ATPase/GTPase